MKKFLVILLLITFIFLIDGLCILWVKKNDSFLFGATAANALFMLILVFVAWSQLTGIHDTSSSDFIHKLKNDYFKESTRRLFHLIERDCIIFNKNNSSSKIDDSFFEVSKDKILNSSLPDDIKNNLLTKIFYSTYEIDDLLLGHFEDIGLFEKTNVMDISMVYEEFDYCICTTHKNKEIEKYLKYCRKGEDNDDIYDKFSYISEKCQSYGKLKKKLANNIIINDILESIWKLQFNLYTKLKNNLDIDHNGKLKKKLDSSITMSDKLKFNLYTALKDNLLDRK